MDPKKRRAALLIAFFAAPALGAAAWRLSRPPETPSDADAARPELPMPAPSRMTETPEPSSLSMVRGDAKPPEAPPPDPLEPIAPPRAAPPTAPPAAVPPAPPAWRPPRLIRLVNLRHWLYSEDAQNLPPVPPRPNQAQPQPPKPAPVQASPATAPTQPSPAAVQKPPSVIRHQGPYPGSANTSQSPTTQVTQAAPPPEGEVAASLTPTDASAQTVDVHSLANGPPDTPPPPNPIAPNGTGSACLVAGAYQNSWTGVCYATRQACQAAQPRGQCTQPPGVKRKAAPQ